MISRISNITHIFSQYFKTITFVCEIYPEKITSLDPGLQVNYYQSSLCNNLSLIIITSPANHCFYHLRRKILWLPWSWVSLASVLMQYSPFAVISFRWETWSWLFLPFSCDLRNFFCRIYLLSFQVLGCHMIRQKAQVRMALSYVNIHYQMFSDYFSFSLGFSNLWATAPFSQALDGPYFKVEWIWMCSYGLRFKFHQYSGPI